jgi:hypothetical protein
MDHY